MVYFFSIPIKLIPISFLDLSEYPPHSVISAPYILPSLISIDLAYFLVNLQSPHPKSRYFSILESLNKFFTLNEKISIFF